MICFRGISRANSGFHLVGVFKRNFAKYTLSQVYEEHREKDPNMIIGLDCTQNKVGYAISRFSDMTPLKFGLVDIQNLPDINERANEILGVLHTLKAEQTQIEGNPKLTWEVALRDHLRVPGSSEEYQRRSQVQQLVGILTFGIKSLFK